MTEAGVRLQILGPLRMWRGGAELDVGPRQQAHLLALLLARAGTPVSQNELIDLIWADDVPASALNLVHKYVGALRRLLEPGLPARESGAYLQRRGTGYVFTAPAAMLDVVAFRELVATARTGCTDLHDEAALDHYVKALELWHGPAGEGTARFPGAATIFAALDAEFFDACVTATAAAVALDRPHQVLPALRLAASMAPLHEPVQAALVSALGAAGQPAEALAGYETVRDRLAEELGIEPGPGLRAAHRRVLTPAGAARPGSETTAPARRGRLVGREQELAALRAVTAGGTGFALVEGEPGVGKTRLLEELAAETGRRGGTAVWGRCLDGGGTPSMWPWVQIVRAVVAGLPGVALTGELGRLLEPGGDALDDPGAADGGARFRLFEQVADLLGRAPAPLVLIVDDLQWADTASLRLLGHLATRSPGGPVVIGALRDRAPAPGPELARLLATAARVPGHRRLHLGPLGPADVAEIVRAETGLDPGPGAAAGLHARTAGNPFFVRELVRLPALAGRLTEAAVARAEVPATVRDVVRDRMAGLGAGALELVRIAALAGRETDVGLLARAAGLDGQSCLDRLEPLAELGVLEPVPGAPHMVRFTHDLVRESVAGNLPARLAPSLHLRIADADEGDEVAERLAHHLRAAGPLVPAARTAEALMAAGRRAAAKSAFEAAERQLETAVEVARAAGLGELELEARSQLSAVVGVHLGYVGSSFEPLEQAEQLARAQGRQREASDFLLARFFGMTHSLQIERSGRLARRLLEEGEASADPVVQSAGLQAWSWYQWETGEIGEALRFSARCAEAAGHLPGAGEEHPVRRDLWLLRPAAHGLISTVHGDLDAARATFAAAEAAAGDDPNAVTIWAQVAALAGAFAGDPAVVRKSVGRCQALGEARPFTHLDPDLRLLDGWARAVTGAAGALADAEQALTALLTVPRAGLPAHLVLVAEAALAARQLDRARALLDQAQDLIDASGERYAEGLLLLVRARLLAARGEPAATVRAAAERARARAAERGAHLFAVRAQEQLTS